VEIDKAVDSALKVAETRMKILEKEMEDLVVSMGKRRGK
jgi:hypothetical protein